MRLIAQEKEPASLQALAQVLPALPTIPTEGQIQQALDQLLRLIAQTTDRCPR